MTKQVVVIDVVGLTPRLLRKMPRLRQLPLNRELETVLPAVTCSAQATFLTGTMPSEHGIVGNGWYFRDLGEVFLWRQHNKLVQGEKVWDVARRKRPVVQGGERLLVVRDGRGDRSAGDAAADLLRRRPQGAGLLHPPGGAARSPDVNELGDFPLFHYWGPTASIKSSQWIVAASRHILAQDNPGSAADVCAASRLRPAAVRTLRRSRRSAPRSSWTRCWRRCWTMRRLADATVIVLSEYGITDVSRPVDVNRVLRREGLLEVHTQDGMEYLDPWTSRAFAVADHQLAHVYVRDPADIDAVAKLVRTLPGVAEVLDAEGKRRYGLDHERAGELVAVAEPDSWFTYYYWLDDARAPDFARAVEIHRKPGYDPAELFFDPCRPAGQAPRRFVPAAQETRPPLRDAGRPAGSFARPRLPRPPPRRTPKTAQSSSAPTRIWSAKVQSRRPPYETCC